MATVPRRVTSSDGVSIAVHEYGDPGAPTVVAVHGYPDNHHVWDGVAEVLSDRFHVVAYDVRGCGDSEKPRGRQPYRMTNLVGDLAAVIAAVSPDRPVHLLAHDWGSIQCWPALTDARTASSIASFTSISGPSLDYAGAWIRDVRAHPRASARQVLHSYYIALFQLPVLPEALARLGVLDRVARRGSDPAAPRPPRALTDKINGIRLYRANMIGGLTRGTPVPVTQPVQVVVASGDAFVTPALAAGAPRPWVPDLVVRTVEGGHWTVSERPQQIGALVAEFVATQGEPRGPRRKARR